MTPDQDLYSMRRRLSLQLMVGALVVLGAVSLAVYAATHSLVERNQQRYLNVKVNKMTETAQSFMREAGDAPDQGRAAYRALLVRNAERRPGSRLELALADGSPFYADPDEEAHRFEGPAAKRDFVLPGLDGQAAFRGSYAIDGAQDAALLRQIAWVLLAATLGGALLAAASAGWVVQRGLRPLRALTRQTERIAGGELSQRLQLRRPVAELQPWVQEFNGLMDKVQQTYGQLEAFNADVAHELRTPLAALIGKTEVTLSRERSADELSTTLQANLEELHRMAALVNDMLFLSKADHGALARRSQPVDLAAAAASVAEFYEAAASERQLSIAVQGSVTLPIDEPLFKRAVSNLVSNATRYAAAGSVIEVRIEEKDNEAWLTVHNQGPRIAPEHLPKLFDRFYRADTARTERDSHHGLGLAIVAAIARMHKGRTRAESGEAQGSGWARLGFSVARG
jgi:two-component system, OmpR family, heavy metal sensor histidine kinase CusS